MSHGRLMVNGARIVLQQQKPPVQSNSVRLKRARHGSSRIQNSTISGPQWDPEGKYLYFLSYREFNPVYDALHFDLGFPTAMRPLLVTLQKTLGNPFVPEPRPLEEEKEDKDKEDEEQDEKDKASDEKSENEKKKDKREPITIDLEGITQRVVAFPYPHGRYGQIAGIEGKAIFTSFPVQETPSG